MSLLRTAARAAVASSVHGRVQRRQQSRWARPVQTPGPPPRSGPEGLDAQLEQLARLGELKANGVITDAEFEFKKAAILHG